MFPENFVKTKHALMHSDLYSLLEQSRVHPKVSLAQYFIQSVRAMEIIYSLEKEKRGIYAGSIGYFAFSKDIDTCIAIRTMLFKNGNVYFQAGGGIVYDSVPEEEYEETINKLRSNVTAIEKAELFHQSSTPL
jgi:isochorismate synthase EntC